jgi:hypothetical protein
MNNKKVACMLFNLSTATVSNDDLKNYDNDTFFAPNAVNSFKKWNPDVDTFYLDDNGFKEMLKELNITEYYENVGVVRIHVIKELMKQKGYTKCIMLGIDTFTCARLDEFLDDDITDMICSAGPPYSFIKTEYWAPPIVQFTHDNQTYQDVAFINADVVCINNVKMAELLYDKSIEYWTSHAEQGGMNWCYINQDSLGVKVSIVDFPYLSSKVVYNVRSKGIACGGYQMMNGKLLSGRNGQVISDIYPTTEYSVIDNKLFTKDGKQIKVFHYAEGLGCRTDKDEQTYAEAVHEMKTMWFNKETINFLEQECGCNFK